MVGRGGGGRGRVVGGLRFSPFLAWLVAGVGCGSINRCVRFELTTLVTENARVGQGAHEGKRRSSNLSLRIS